MVLKTIIMFFKTIVDILWGVKMTEIKTFKIEQKFNDVEELYNYLFDNIKFIADTIGIEIEKPLLPKMLSVVGQEKITERNILFFASKSGFVESLGELITLASVFEPDIIVFFVNDAHKNYLMCLNWLQSICNADTQFIMGKALF